MGAGLLFALLSVLKMQCALWREGPVRRAGRWRRVLVAREEGCQPTARTSPLVTPGLQGAGRGARAGQPGIRRQAARNAAQQQRRISRHLAAVPRQPARRRRRQRPGRDVGLASLLPLVHLQWFLSCKTRPITHHACKLNNRMLGPASAIMVNNRWDAAATACNKMRRYNIYSSELPLSKPKLLLRRCCR